MVPRIIAITDTHRKVKLYQIFTNVMRGLLVNVSNFVKERMNDFYGHTEKR
jgi:hypothetical protein